MRILTILTLMLIPLFGQANENMDQFWKLSYQRDLSLAVKLWLTEPFADSLHDQAVAILSLSYLHYRALDGHSDDEKIAAILATYRQLDELIKDKVECEDVVKIE